MIKKNFLGVLCGISHLALQKTPNIFIHNFYSLLIFATCQTCLNFISIRDKNILFDF